MTEHPNFDLQDDCDAQDDEADDYGFDPADFDHAGFNGFRPEPGCTRHEGWTADKQKTFLEALSEGFTVERACDIVGLSRQSAYALRNAPRGAAFALGWQAAVLIARNALADELMARAFKGQRESDDHDGRVVTRHRFDNRLALAMLNRLDRMADAAADETTHAAARLVAADFPQYLDLVARDASPARAGLFLGARIEPRGGARGATPAKDDDLAPVRALARADTWLRTHTDIADAVPADDLDPGERAHWTAEQWVRADTVGLVALAPEPPAEADVQPCQPCQPDPLEGHVWQCEQTNEWRTDFPPPEGFHGHELHEFGDCRYERELSTAEAAAWQALHDAELEDDRREAVVQRDAWLAAVQLLVEEAHAALADDPRNPQAVAAEAAP